MKAITNKIERLVQLRIEAPTMKEKKYYSGLITVLKEVRNSLDVEIDNLNHWCSYNGIQGENKDELLNIVKL